MTAPVTQTLGTVTAPVTQTLGTVTKAGRRGHGAGGPDARDRDEGSRRR